MILVILLGLLIPLPLAVHCLFLAKLNRRPQPVLVWGVWDFAEVLFAASGFLLFGGPCVLAGFNQHYRDLLLFGPLRPVPRLVAAGGWLWQAVWVGYFVAVIAGAAFMLWRRRLATSIYNIEPQAFSDCLGAVLDRLKLDWLRRPDCILVGYRDTFAAAAADEAANVGWVAGAERSEAPARHAGASLTLSPGDPSAADGYRRLPIRVDVFAAMRHVSLYWPPGADLLRHEIESGLAKEFARVSTRHNPVAAWLFSAAVCLATVMAFTVLFLVMVAYYTLQRPY